MTAPTPTAKLTLPEAIGRQEGFGIPGSAATRNHNPGNIIAGHFALTHGAVGVADGYAVFPDDATGKDALRALLTGPAYKGKTVEVAINRFCPPPVTDQPLTEGNDPDVYVRNVCEWCQCTPGTIIDELMG
jgi:hypothetical protein